MASIHTQVSQTLFANKVCETFICETCLRIHDTNKVSQIKFANFICETFCVYTWKVSQIKFHKLYSRIKFAKTFCVYTWKGLQIKFHKLYSRILFAKLFAYTHGKFRK